ncbi:MAG TPA: ATP-binding protein [Micropepsaceae bacterium]|nr:ATP-binding protein [Micropepsaceae bacterium]
MAMSEVGRAQLRAWRRPFLLLSATAIVALMAVAVSGTAIIPATILGTLAIAGLALYLSAPRRAAPNPAASAPPVQDAGNLPDSARKVFECIDDPLLILDLAGRVVFANRASQSLVGAEAERKRISAVLRNPEVLEAVERVLAGGEPETIVFSVPVPVQRHYETNIARTGSPLVLVQFRDLTAMRRAEELRADFVANASHELRTPLAAVTGFIDTLRGHAKDDAEARERFLEIMSVEAGRMRRLIDDLLSLTRIELNEHNPPAGEVDVVALVREAAAALGALADSDRISIKIAPHEALHVVGDRDELTQVFQNLIHNAIKYGREGSEVRVRFGRTPSPTRREGAGQVFVAVEDEGEGIPREAIPRLTERFYRVDVKRSRERGGTGLGLAIVKHIVNRHQGRLQIESTAGVGSIFTVSLPATAAATVYPG